MNTKTTIFLLVLLIIVGGAYVILDRMDGEGVDEETPSGGSGKVGTPVFAESAFPHDDADSITIERGEERITLVKEGDDWRQTEPVEFPLSSWQVEQIAKDAAGLSYVEKFTPGRGDAPAADVIGLASPAAVVTVGFASSGDDAPKAQKITIGDRLGVGGRGYVKFDDDPDAYVVNDDLHKQVIGKKFSELRKKSFDAPKEGTAGKVTLTRDGQTVELVKADGHWSFGGAHSGRAAKDKVKSLLELVGRLYVNEFKSEDVGALAHFGLDDPRIVVRIESSSLVPAQSDDGEEGDAETGGASDDAQKSPAIEILRIGDGVDFKDEYYYATRSLSDAPSHVIFTLPKSFVDDFDDKDAPSFRDARITTVGRNDVTRIGIRRGDEKINLARADGKWGFDDPKPAYGADDGAIGRLLDRLVDARADSYEQGDPEGEPAAVVTLHATGRPEPDVLTIHRRGGEQVDDYLVRRNSETTGYVLSSSSGIRSVFDPVITLRDRVVLALEAETLERVVIEHPEDVKYEFERAPATGGAGEADGGDGKDAGDAGQGEAAPAPWKLVGHDRFESEDFSDMLQALLPLTATGWQEESTWMAPPLFVKLFGADGVEATIRIDPETRDGSASGNAPEAFEHVGFGVERSLVDQIASEFRHRTLVDLQTDGMKSITVGRGDVTTTLKRDSEGKYSGTSGEELDEAAVGDLFDTLAGLRVKRFREGVEIGETMIRIEVEPADGDPLVLHVDPETGQGRLKPDLGFELDESDVEKLAAGVVTDGSE
ncbi:MAG: hypothetical protein CMJ18_06520 [Phycisphaeraceae bacterium]|nr:hypothetical protein [Phycisphaeraceae bacterium]